MYQLLVAVFIMIIYSRYQAKHGCFPHPLYFNIFLIRMVTSDWRKVKNMSKDITITSIKFIEN